MEDNKVIIMNGKKKLIFKELSILTMAINKLYNVPMIPGKSKYKLLKLVQKLKEDERLFQKIRQDIIDEEVKKDENGKPITKQQVINGLNMEVYDFKDINSYNEKIGPILEQVIDFSPEYIDIPVIDICNSPLTIQDIELLLEYGILKEDEKDARGKIITTKN